ncbi:MAG: hypothetical protein ACI9EW_000316 [Cellvibrionaceae bacterium]|jgi:hypothetical protein
MKKLFVCFALISLISCTTPPEAVESPAPLISENGSGQEQVENKVTGPVSTAVVVIAGESARQESYPSPQAQVAAEGYPEPEAQPESAVVGYPEPVEASSETDGAVLPAAPAIAGIGDVDVLFVSARLSGDGTWNFAVTLEHADNGWEDYADGWDVVLPDGSVIKPSADSPFTRLLTHPHDTEQPFTRSQSGIVIPDQATTVFVRAHELVEGYGATVVAVDLTAASGEGFEVIR